MEWGFLLGLGAITLAVIGLVILLGLKLNTVVHKKASDITIPLNITPSGNVLFACVVAFWVYCGASRALRPESLFGGFLNTPDGVAAVLVGSGFVAAIAGAILERLGYPIARKDNGRGGD